MDDRPTTTELPRVTFWPRPGFSDADVTNIMGENWVRMFRNALPA